MKLFSKPAAIVEETGKLQHNEKFRREDRADVSSFYNGAPPLTDEQAADLGFTVNANHLFGYNEIQDGSDQILGLYTKPEVFLDVTLDAAPPGKRSDIGMAASYEASRVLKKIKSFKTDYQGVSGDAALHGEALFFHPNTTFPLPRQCPLSKMLIPDDASTDKRELSHFGIEKFLALRHLTHFYKTEAKGWNRGNLGKLLSKIYDGCLGEHSAIDEANLEEVEYRRQENSTQTHRTRPGVETVYFFQQCPDKPGMPYDLTITLANGTTDTSTGKSESVLYQGDDYIQNVDGCLLPFFLDCIIGGAPKWHRVLGRGHLNYHINHAVELLVNRAQQATFEGSMNLWRVKDTGTREAVQQILLKHNGVLPEGVELVPNRFEPNFGGMLEMIQFFRQQGSRNNGKMTPNDGGRNDVLEVQAMAEMNQGASQTNNRTTAWYDYLDDMWTEAFARLCNTRIQPDEPGYSEVMDFQGAMKRRNIDLRWLQRANVTVKAVRIVGDGLRHKELGAVQFLTANRNQYAPEVQPKITRICTGLALDNYRLAEELTPIQQEPDSPQLMRAESENAVMLTQRAVLKPNADDIDEIHVMQHFPAMEILIADALQFQKAAFTPQQADAFKKIGGHIFMHVQRIEGRAMNNRKDPEREKAATFMDHLNSLAAMGEKLLNNMEQTQAGQQQEIDPVEMARLQLESEKLQLGREKLGHSVEKFNRTQGTREQALAFEQVLKNEKDRRDAIRTRSDTMRSDVETAVKVAQLNAPKSKAE